MKQNVKMIPFSELFEWGPKSNIGSRQGLDNGKYTLYISSQTDCKYYDEYLEDGEAIVFGTGGNPSIHYVNGKFAYTNHTEVAKTKSPETIYTKFYYYYFQKNKYEDLQSTFVGGGIKNSSKKKIGNLLVPVINYDEQVQVVTKIEEQLSQLDSGVETLKKTKAQLEVYRRTVINAAFSGSLTSKSHSRIQINLPWESGSSISGLPEIPLEWKYIKLSYLGDLGRGKSKHRPRGDIKLFEGGKYPFLQTSEVKSADKVITNYSKMYNDFGLHQSKLWKKGTLCITIAANIAETAFLGIDACFPDSVVGFTPNETVKAEYIKYFIDSQKLKLWAYAPATAQKNINLNTLENLIVPYCSVEEQSLIVDKIEARLSTCRSIESTVDKVLQQSDAMRQSILKKAFEGEL